MRGDGNKGPLKLGGAKGRPINFPICHFGWGGGWGVEECVEGEGEMGGGKKERRGWVGRHRKRGHSAFCEQRWPVGGERDGRKNEENGGEHNTAKQKRVSEKPA